MGSYVALCGVCSKPLQLILLVGVWSVCGTSPYTLAPGPSHIDEDGGLVDTMERAPGTTVTERDGPVFAPGRRLLVSGKSV